MKNLVLLLLSISVILNSCSIQKKRYDNFYTINWNSNYEKEIDINSINEETELNQINNDNHYSDEEIENSSNENKITDKDSIECDEILFKNGDEIKVQIIEITPNEIKYKKCNYLDGPLITINKSGVFSIVYKNGDRELIKTEKITINNESVNKNTSNESYKPKKDGLAIASFIFGIIGLPILGLIFGYVQLNLIKKYPQYYDGDGMANTGVLLSWIWLCLIIISILILI